MIKTDPIINSMLLSDIRKLKNAEEEIITKYETYYRFHEKELDDYNTNNLITIITTLKAEKNKNNFIKILETLV